MLRLRAESIEITSERLRSQRGCSLTVVIGSSREVIRINDTVYSGSITSLDAALCWKVLPGITVTVELCRPESKSISGSGACVVHGIGPFDVVVYEQGSTTQPICVLRFSVTGDVSDSRRSSGSIPSEPAVGHTSTETTSVTSDILAHFFSDITSTKQLIETYKRWAIRCGPLRFVRDSFANILLWTDPHTTCLVLTLWIWICMDPQTASVFVAPLLSVGLLYCILLVRTGALHVRVLGSPSDGGGFYSEDVETNLKFNNHTMTMWCDMYDRCKSYNLNILSQILVSRVSRYHVSAVVCGWIGLYIVPVNLVLTALVLVPLLATCPIIRSRKTTMTALLKPQPHSVLHEVYENQRWWLGNWSDKGLAIGTAPIHPWSDVTGKVLKNKSDIPLPTGFEWQDLWHVDDTGWMYAINFETEWFHSDQRSSDFVRKRRWIRTARHVAHPPN